MIISEETYNNDFKYLQDKYGTYSEYLTIVKAHEVYARAGEYSKFFLSNIVGIKTLSFVIYPEKDNHFGNLLKILTTVKVVRTLYRVHILIVIEPHKFAADCGAYQAKFNEKDDTFESLYCRCRTEDIMTEKYTEELNDAVLNEHYLRRGK